MQLTVDVGIAERTELTLQENKRQKRDISKRTKGILMNNALLVASMCSVARKKLLGRKTHESDNCKAVRCKVIYCTTLSSSISKIIRIKIL